jgi:hypothetical protein
MFVEGAEEGAAIVVAQCTQGGTGREQGELVLSHSATPISTRNFVKPSLMRVFTVPSGAPVSAAISDWEYPPK